MKLFLIAFLAGLASALGFEPLGIWPLTLLAFATLLWLIQRAPTLRNALALGWWFGFGQFVLGLNWIATAFTYQAAMPAWLGWVSVVLLSIYLAVYPAMAAGLAWRYGRGDRLAIVFLFAAAWIVTEWLRATMFTGFAWNPVGVSLLPTAAARLSSIIGTYGLSGVAVLMAGALLLIAERYRKTGFILLAAIAAISLLRWGFDVPSSGPAGIQTTIVQPNIGQEQKWTSGFEQRNFARLTALSVKRRPGPRLLLWPEAAITEPLEDARSGFYYRRLTRRVRDKIARVLPPGDILKCALALARNSREARRVLLARLPIGLLRCVAQDEHDLVLHIEAGVAVVDEAAAVLRGHAQAVAGEDHRPGDGTGVREAERQDGGGLEAGRGPGGRPGRGDRD